MSQPQDDEGTVIRPTSAPSAFPLTVDSPRSMTAGAPSAAGEDGLSLRIGTRLGEFEITARIGEGGFSIVYLALDHSLERTVALKEYMPSSLATRAGTTQVLPRSERFRETFEAGLRSFVNEAKLLAQFDHPSLVKVYRFWEANGTAYMVMPFYQGVTVKDAVRAMPERPDEAWLLTLLAPLTQALLVIHAERCYHRDIAPDNVILLAGSDRPLLLDFGAARRVIGDMTQGLTVILKSGYAPVEQYAEVPGMKQGPWTDVYALAAVVYWAVTGATPPPSVGRMLSDSFVPLGTCAAGRYSMRFVAAIDRALLVRPEQRTQSIAALRQDLGITDEGSSHPVMPPPALDSDATVIRPIGSKPVAAATAVRVSRNDPEPARATGSPTRATAAVEGAKVRPSRRAMLAVSAAGAAVVAVALWWGVRRAGPEVPLPAPAPAQADAVAADRASTPQDVARSTDTAASEATTSAASPSTTSADSATTTSPASTTTAPVNAATTTVPVNAATTTAPVNAATPPAVAETATTVPAPVRKSPAEPVSDPPPPRAAAARRAGTPAEGDATARRANADRGSPRADPQRRERAQADSGNRAECARIFQRLSLGESNPELLDRLKSLKCR